MAIRNVDTGELTYVGAVLGLSESHGHFNDTSNAMATVWDAAKGEPVTVYLGSKFMESPWRPENYSYEADVDATADVLDAWESYWVRYGLQQFAIKAPDDATDLVKGREVTVVRGRKVPIGTTGELFWTGETTYGQRVGFKDAAGTVHWTAASNVEVTNPLDYVADWFEIQQRARQQARDITRVLRDELARRQATQAVAA